MSGNSSMFEPIDRARFLNLAGLVEMTVVLLALGLGWLAGIDPLETLEWDWLALLAGIVVTVPMFGLFLLSMRFPVGPLLPIKRFLIEILGPSLAVCRWYDLVLLAILAGFSEELLFRGLLQPWFARGGYLSGLVGSNLLFGLAHCITPMYAAIAALVGAYLGLSLDATGEPNLLVPIIAHGLYDYLAFLVVARSFRADLPADSDAGSAEVDGTTKQYSEDDDEQPSRVP